MYLFFSLFFISYLDVFIDHGKDKNLCLFFNSKYGLKIIEICLRLGRFMLAISTYTIHISRGLHRWYIITLVS